MKILTDEGVAVKQYGRLYRDDVSEKRYHLTFQFVSTYYTVCRFQVPFLFFIAVVYTVIILCLVKFCGSGLETFMALSNHHSSCDFQFPIRFLREKRPRKQNNFHRFPKEYSGRIYFELEESKLF